MDAAGDREAGVVIVLVDGPRLDVASVPAFRIRVGEAIDGGAARLVIDLSAVELIDSSGLGAIVGAMKRTGRRGSVEIAGARPEVMKVFRVTRMDQVFRFADAPPAA